MKTVTRYMSNDDNILIVRFVEGEIKKLINILDELLQKKEINNDTAITVENLINGLDSTLHDSCVYLLQTDDEILNEEREEREEREYKNQIMSDYYKSIL